MTVSGKWFVFGSALSVGAGFLGGTMFGRRTAPATMVAFGRTFRVGSDIFVDSDALEYLKARADEHIPMAVGRGCVSPIGGCSWSCSMRARSSRVSRAGLRTPKDERGAP
jgi:hypothetical protein